MGSRHDDDYGDYHDFSDDSDTNIEIECAAEPLERFHLYYPVRIGDVLHNRYRIEHKLGWGGFSTVWLAQDLERNVAVALKILIPNAGETELRAHKRLIDRAASPFCLLICQSHFFVRDGDHGHYHLVLVFPVRGPSLRSTFSSIVTPPARRVVAAKHALIALKNLHDAGLVHRDLTLANIMWHIRPIDHLTTRERYQYLGRPQKILMGSPEEGRPGDLVAPFWSALGHLFPPELMQDATVCIGDFGLAFSPDEDDVEGGINGALSNSAPERIHLMKPSFASDVWSYMVIFADLYVGANVIPNVGEIGRMVALIGRFPRTWKPLYDPGDPKARKDWWYDDGDLGAIPSDLGTLEEKVDWFRPEISPEERAHALAFMRRGFVIQPEKRPTAAQLLEDPSFKALMAYYGA